MPVSLFKEKIANQIGVPVGQQRLIFRGKAVCLKFRVTEFDLCLTSVIALRFGKWAYIALSYKATIPVTTFIWTSSGDPHEMLVLQFQVQSPPKRLYKLLD
ncbi:hypothetical protein Prudu_003131, partial [Prunus dulcis]